MKKRKVRIGVADDAVRCEHPDGGALHVLPFDFDEASAYFDAITTESFVYDANGKILRNEKSGDPVIKVQAPIQKQVEYALSRVTCIELLKTRQATDDFCVLEIDGCEGVESFVRVEDEWLAHDTNGNELSSLNVRGKSVDPKVIVLAIIKLMGTDSFEVEITLDTKGEEFTGADGQVATDKKRRVVKRFSENYFLWVPRKCAAIGYELNKATAEN